MAKEIYKILIRFFLKLDNFLYSLVSRLAIDIEGGIHPKHRLIGYHRFFVNNINPGDVVLDIGCGNGALTFDISKKAAEVVGIDLSTKNIKLATKKFSAPNITYILGDALKNIPNKKVNVIILSNVLEHINNRVEFLKKIKKQGSKILVRVPIINRDWITLYKKELGVEYRLDKTHFIEYTLELLEKELEKAGLKVYNYTIQFGEIWAIIR